jgi:hypothetical protein
MIWFYLPESACSSRELPKSVDDYWPWISAREDIDGWGRFSWTLQTYLHLKSDGFPCQLAHHLPSEGVVVAYRTFLPDDLRPGPGVLLVCILGDKEEPGAIGRHPYAQVHIVQNPKDRLLRRTGLWPAYYVPYWPQPGLRPRDPQRGDRFETAAFFGYASNLAPELRGLSWSKRLHDLGLAWHMIPRPRWHDYSDVDVVVAVRSFDERYDYRYKPASKLYNAWRAHVPAVLGAESAYRANWKSELDYLEVASVDSALAALERLRDEPALRCAMIENGRRRAEEVDPRRVAERWRIILTDEVLPRYARWCAASGRSRAAFMCRRAWAERWWAIAGR